MARASKSFSRSKSRSKTRKPKPSTNSRELNVTHAEASSYSLAKDTAELDTTHVEALIATEAPTNDSSHKFITVNYRVADNVRKTIQLERFYIEALEAIGINNIPEFVTANVVGETTVTKNVKCAIVRELVSQATSKS